MKAMIFAAGLGTRLKPLTDTIPKALVPVGGRPLIEIVIDRLKTAGFDDIVINVHHFADMIEEYVRSRHDFGIRIRFSDERDTLLDTGGGILHAKSLLEGAGHFLVHNVDILSDVDLKSFAASAASDALAAAAVPYAQQGQIGKLREHALHLADHEARDHTVAGHGGDHLSLLQRALKPLLQEIRILKVPVVEGAVLKYPFALLKPVHARLYKRNLPSVSF